MERPLAGVRVLAVEQYGAGPYCTMNLAELGAEVIKIEDPRGGDSARQAGPHFLGPNESLFFQPFNLAKKSLALDMRAPEGKAIFLRLVETTDAVINNLRGDQPAKLGLTHQALSRHNARIVCGHLSGYGRFGERATWPAYDFLAQAEAGFMSLTGEPEGPPSRLGVSMIDFMTGMTLAFATVAALFQAARTGRGRDVDVTLYDVAIHQLTYPAVWVMNADDPIARRPRSGHPVVVPCEWFPCADGRIFIMAMIPKFWEALCDIVGHGELPADPRFATPEARRANRDTLADILDAALGRETVSTWMSRFAGKVPVAPVLTLESALSNPHLADRGGIQSLSHPLAPGLKVLSNPIGLDGVRLAASPAPVLGQHTEEVLAGLGVMPDERARLRRAGVVG